MDLSEPPLAETVTRDRVEMSSEGFEASFTVLGTNGLVVDWGRYTFLKGTRLDAFTEEPLIELHCQLDGHVRMTLDGFGGPVHLRPGDSNFFFMPLDAGAIQMPEDLSGEVFEIKMAQSYLEGLAQRHPEAFEPMQEKVARGEPFRLSVSPIRITPAMLGTINRVTRSFPESALSKLFLESQVMELLARAFDGVASDDRHNGHRLPPGDVDKIYAARAILLSRVEDPPSLAELTRLVGTNEFKLKKGFREVFGTSAYALLLDHKLETARRLLLDTGMSIAEVAYRVGYSHPAHLTNAFRKKYGIRPSDLR